ncbi:hypothetical protein BAE32_01650 [Chlamydia psittaci]|nr:hypothetical protein AO9_04880 [Chlamydia psittaci Mat116]EPJ28557.1 hypothetical protein CPC1998_0700 [Chlamydia psittaci C19/98]EPP30285.1 hypothetical protein CP082626L3_0081 [Chlamydia psittaci 08-2626_L3]KPZ37676.1 hypothetical protein GWG_03390 [Chlamydia psittaci DD34]KXH24473.1 hypothetical protein P059_01710 [Chlamydia psittaci UGA]ODJ01257.1 hypothetical protein BAE35_01630 [Chlamydia psittaci]
MIRNTTHHPKQSSDTQQAVSDRKKLVHTRNKLKIKLKDNRLEKKNQFIQTKASVFNIKKQLNKERILL